MRTIFSIFLILFTVSVDAQRSIDADTIKSSDWTKTWTMPAQTGTMVTSGNIVNADVSGAAAIAYPKLNLTGSIVNADVSGAAAIDYSKLNLGLSILNSDVSNSAAIAYSKLNLGSSIVNSDISNSAAIDYSKLNLANQIVDADISGSAAISRGKLASGTASHVIVNDASGVMSSEAQLAISRGGTGQSTANTALNALLPNQSGNTGLALVTDGTNTSWSEVAGGGGSSGVNLLADDNPEFSDTSPLWTNPGGSNHPARTTGTGLGIFDADGYISWDGSIGGEVICSSNVTFNGLFGNNGEAIAWTKNASGTATHKLQVYGVNGGVSTLIREQSITSSTTPKKQSFNFAIPTSTANYTHLKLCLQAQVDEPSIDIDHVYLGETTNIVSVENESDWSTATTMTFTAGTSGTFVKGSGTLVDSIQYKRRGDVALIRFKYGHTVAGSNGTGNILINLPAGLVADTSRTGVYTGTDATTSLNYHLKGNIGGNTGTSNGSFGSAYMYDSTRFVISYEQAGTLINIWGSSSIGLANATTNMWGWFEVPIQGWSASASAAAADQTNYGWTSYTPTFTGFGTVATHECYHKRDAEDMLVRCKFTSGTTTAIEARVSLPQTAASSPTSIWKCGDGASSVNSTQEFNTLCEPSVAYVTFGLGNGGAAAPLTKRQGSQIFSGGEVFSFNARVKINGWYENNKAPVLVGSVTSNTVTSAERVERISFAGATTATNCTASPCTIHSQTGTWASSVTRSGTGTYAIVTSGWTAVPDCVCTSMDYSGPYSRTCSFRKDTSTTTSLVIWGSNSGGTNTDGTFSVICMGAR